MLLELYKRIRYLKKADRLGRDVFTSHWKLHFRSTMLKLCKSKFKYFDETAEFRPGAYAVACSRISIGKGVVIRPNTMLHANDLEGGAEIIIEDNVLIGSGVHIYVDNHRFNDSSISIIDQGNGKSSDVVLKKGCWIGANVTILPGVIIGENAVVGAGAIVTKSVPPRAVAAGNPARIIRNIE